MALSLTAATSAASQIAGLDPGMRKTKQYFVRIMEKKTYTGRSNINLYNMDNMEFMKGVEDNYYELAICDPEYGIGADVKNSKKELKTNKSAALSKSYGDKKWDSNVATIEYFKELFPLVNNPPPQKKNIDIFQFYCSRNKSLIFICT